MAIESKCKLLDSNTESSNDNSSEFDETKTYIISRFNNNSNIKLKLAQFIVNTSSVLTISSSTSTDELFNYILYRVTELINLILKKSSLNISYLKLLIDFISIDMIKFDEIIQLPTNLNDFYIYLSYSIMQLYSLDKNNAHNNINNYRNSRLDTSSILSFSKSWKFVSNKNNNNHSNLSNLSTKRRCSLYFQKFILLCCYFKNTF